ncbi:hypothetical protein ACWEF9_11325 [Streptomyces sp. NPDC004980]
MARFDHLVTVASVDRAWFEECAGIVLDTAESTRARRGDIVLGDGGLPIPGIRLLKGRHLRPGARYEITSARDGAGGASAEGDDETAGTSWDGDRAAGDPPAGASVEDERTVGAPVEYARTAGTPPGSRDEVITLAVREWRRSTAIAVEQRMESAELTGRLVMRLRTPDRPSVLDVGFDLRAPGGGSLQRASGRAKLDLTAWWAAAAARPGSLPAARAPLAARAKHRLGRARLTVTPRPAADGTWEVGVTLTVRGRSLLRPVAALALFFGQVPLRRAFRSGVDQAAAGWNEALASGPLPDPAELRAELVKALTD